MIADFTAPDDDGFAEQQLRRLLGKHLLVKIAYADDKGIVRKEEMIHGTIEEANRESGIKLLLTGTYQSRLLPLDATTLEMSRFRDYELTTTGEKITGVDFTMSLTLPKTQ